MPIKKGARKPPAAARLPHIDAASVNAIQAYLQEHYDAKRPPEVAARMLALIVALDRTKQPFPPRKDVVDAFGLTGPYGLDAAIYTALNRGLITQHIDVVSGRTQAREGVNQQRRFEPSAELLGVVRSTERRVA